MAVYGYVRNDISCPTVDQFSAIREYECREVFLEVGEVKEDTELRRLLTVVAPGDTVVTTAVFVLGKTLSHLFAFLEKLRERQVRFVSVQEGIDSAETYEFFHYLALLTYNERETKRVLARQSIELSRRKGVQIGRPALSDETIKKIETMYNDRKTLREIAAECDISLGSAHKYVVELKQKTAG